jgi:tetratricopeptide (TPR) repeat protein
MTVVGHFEQMRQSVCYQKSQMTCITCHDLHQRSRPQDSTAFYRQKCLTCHTPQSCTLDQAQRLKKDPADNCMACHMPRGDTDVAHVAFTHHRIGRHSAEPPSSQDKAPELVPTSDITSLGPADRERNLGLAYLEVSRDAKYSQFAEVFQQRTRKHLKAAHAAGLRDGMTSLGLAELSHREKSARTTRYAREALESPNASAHVRTLSLMLLAECAAEDGDFEPASRYLEELVQIRRQGEDWRILGVAYLMQKQQAKAIEAFQKALEMRPFDPAVHAGLEEAFKREGDLKRASEHREKAQWLFRHRRE